MKRIVELGALIGLVGAAMAGFARWRRWERNWGATPEEVERGMSGDEIVPDAVYLTTRAITVNAPPADIYTWLVQMGKERGGLYSYDFLDRLFGYIDAPSATRVMPEFQNLQAGDVIPLGRGASFPVRGLDPNRAFVLGDPEAGWSWSTCMYPIDEEHTRLVTRNRGSVESGLRWRIGMVLLDIAAFIMVRRWLIVLKGRAEGLQAQRAASGPSAATENAPAEAEPVVA